ncbi:MAG: hypothetical protein ABSG43_22170 [Solirubrobacteraceae bacterium]
MKVSRASAMVPVSCAGASRTACSMSLTLSLIESLKGGKIIAVAASGNHARTTKSLKRTVVIGTATVTLPTGESRTVKVGLNATGQRLLAARHALKAMLAVAQSGQAIAIRTLTLKATARKRKVHLVARRDP